LARQVAATLRVRKMPASEPTEAPARKPVAGVESSESVRAQKA